MPYDCFMQSDEYQTLPTKSLISEKFLKLYVKNHSDWDGPTRIWSKIVALF